MIIIAVNKIIFLTILARKETEKLCINVHGLPFILHKRECLALVTQSPRLFLILDMLFSNTLQRHHESFFFL